MPNRLKRVLLAAAMAILTLNVWTGSPLLALWVGSRVQGEGPPKMSAVVVVIVVMVACSIALYQLLKVASRAYDDVTGHAPTVRTPAPWLRSMRAERPSYGGERPTVSVAERMVVLAVLAGAIAFEVWFFFFSGSPI